MRYSLLVACCFLTVALGVDPAAAVAGSPLAGIDGSIMVAQSGNCPAAPGGTGLLTDGDFSGAQWPGVLKTYSAGQEFAPDWLVMEATIDLNGTYFQTPNGLCSVDLDGTPGYGAVRHEHNSDDDRPNVYRQFSVLRKWWRAAVGQTHAYQGRLSVSKLFLGHTARP